MKTFNKCLTIRRTLLTRAAEVMLYENWSPEYAVKRLRDFPAAVLKDHPELGQIQPAELTAQECDSLGFGRWNKDKPLRLIPLWLYPFLADEIQTTCIDGSSVLRKADMDTDHRMGQLAYSITPAVPG